MTDSTQPLLILTIEGVLQSWGLRARWDYRDSSIAPTKSAVIGIIGAALGIPRNDSRLREYNTLLQMGVRIDRPGTMMQDYHTVIMNHLMANGKPKGKGTTIVSRREYLQDAAFLVIIKGKRAVLEEIATALQHPHWPYYLGRKACIPTRPLFCEITDEYTSIKEALHTYPPPMHDPRRNETYYAVKIIIEDETGDQLIQDHIPHDITGPYDFRTVREEVITVPFIDPEAPTGGSVPKEDK